MLGRLVNKFQQYSLNDQQTSTDNSVSVDGLTEIRRNAVSEITYPNSFDDSGTESENEEELEQLETSYLTSIATDNIQLGPSPPVLTNSPPLFSDIDTNSWDSAGCESDIAAQEPNDEEGDLSNDFAMKDDFSTQWNKEPYINCSSIPIYSLDTDKVAAAAGGNRAINSGNMALDVFCVKYGAFRPFRRRLKEQEIGAVSRDSAPSPGLQGIVGEKRRYDNIISKERDDESENYAAFFQRSNSIDSEIPRETLVACRRTPVKLIIYNPDGLRKNVSKSFANSTSDVIDFHSESPPFRPVKRGRLNTCERPSLDFEKMRERMMTDWNNGYSTDSTKAENRVITDAGLEFIGGRTLFS
uniref:Uncharacterized protein n=1 Tax=Syphacia muris TaxID=451379 RepID=A0A0N5AEJ9_9BILA